MMSKNSSQPSPSPGATPLADLLNNQHPLCQLADAIEWESFETEFGKFYSEDMGRPALPIRLLVGLHYLKHLYNVSDEIVVASWVENPYWQYFCGNEYFQHDFPCDSSSLVTWRKRVGADGIKYLLKQTIETAKREHALKPQYIKQVNVDTTVQEKAIGFPTDARLYHKARRALVRLAKQLGLKLRQSYKRLSKKALAWQGRYATARQMKRAQKQTRKLRTYLGRVIRNIERYCGPLSQKQSELLEIARRIYEQQREDKGKVYSIHAPEVECIAKGKAHKKYEFGCKVSLVTTSKENWIVSIDAVSGNPYDGATLKPALKEVEEMTGEKPQEAYVDKGYRGSEHHPEGVEVYISGRKNLPRQLTKMLKRRSAIEPVIGHSKHDHGLERNHLLGKAGDRINAILSGCGWNLKKLWRIFAQTPALSTSS